MTAAIIRSGIPATRIGSGVGITLGYSIGNLGKSIVWTSFDTFLLYYLIRIAGFTPLVAGGLLTVVMLWDGCADIAVAYLADRHDRPDALGRLILLGAPLCGVSFWLIFALSPGQGRPFVLAAVVLCRVGYTLCDIGHNTLLVRIAATDRSATTVSGMRLIFSAMGAGLVGLAATIILSADFQHQRAAFAPVAAIGGAIYVVTLMIAISATRHLPAARADCRPCDATVPFGFGALWRNRRYRSVLYLIAIQAGIIPLFTRALPFVGEAAHGSAGWAGTALTIITASQALSLPGWMMLTRWRSSNAVLALGYGAMIVALGLLAVRSDGAIGMIGLSLLGVAQAGMNMAIWAMLALSIRCGATDGARNEALPVGLFLAVLKSSAGIGNGLLAASVATGNRWCSDCIGHGAGPIVFAATTLPVLGCAAAVLLVLGNRRFMSAGSARPAA